MVGVVGAGGIGWERIRASRMLAYNEMLGITVVMFIMVLGAEHFTRILKQRAELATIKLLNKSLYINFVAVIDCHNFVLLFPKYIFRSSRYIISAKMSLHLGTLQNINSNFIVPLLLSTKLKMHSKESRV
ncbi:hypothetical protein [Salicibibacter kimchii]|uniref:hypothetical protein n=1 Tax=Salicibibacter kimchii TaxID=2099786 RepID=UPI00135C59F3|nr:hypothetical protein [Salicibibacter kimchii]